MKLILPIAAAALLLMVSDHVQAQIFDDADESVSNHEWFGELRLRGDQVSFPTAREDIERGRLHGLFGVRWFANDRLEVGLALKGGISSDDNDDTLPSLDNEEADFAELGMAYVRARLSENWQVQVGKERLPLNLSPLIWDNDLLPIGASFQAETAIGDFDRLSLAAGYFAGDHIDEDESRIGAGQLAWHIREGGRVSSTVAVSYIEFDDLDELTRDGRVRTNRVVDGQLASDYELVDLQLHLEVLTALGPLHGLVDVVHNLGADSENDGGRVSLVLGDSLTEGGWEFGYAAHRIQRDAVMASFNEDDWWFPSRMRGSMPWIAWGNGEGLQVRLAGFRERRDGSPYSLDRLLLDFNLNF